MKNTKRQSDRTSPAAARELLEQTGLRRTASRVAVLQLLADAQGPLTHAEVVRQLEDTGFGAPTLFRCLSDLVEAGLAVRMDLGDHVWRFASHETNQVQHAHFVCVDCGRATCLLDQSGQFTTAEKGHLRKIGEVSEVILKGHCNDCR